MQNFGKMVQLIQAKNPSEAWLRAVKLILSSGNKVGNLKEILYLIVEIENPLEIDERVDKTFRSLVNLGKKSGNEWITWGIKQLTPSTVLRWHDTYYSRITKYREKTNQLNYVVERLKRKPNSKQLFCITFDPELDIRPNMPYSPKMPCLTALDFKDRNGLNLFAVFRSHDFGRKAYGNYIGLGKLLREICEKSNRDLGRVICFSCSAHVRLSELKQIENCIKELEK
jgi:thymidylate synthase